MKNMIDITGSDLVKLVKAAYNLSRPVGLGYMHFKEGSLTDEEAKSLINEDDERTPVSLDYVKGRACKMTVFKEDGKLFIRDNWFDHSDSNLLALLDEIAV